MKLLHISDTHTYHDLLQIPKDIDIIVHSGDCSNPMNKIESYKEIMNFIEWDKGLDVKHKIYVAGNHDSAIESNTLGIKDDFAMAGIIYLENDFVELEGLKIFGSPLTPSFGQWSFMKDRSKLDGYWKNIPDDTDILIVHGPPKGIMDFSYARDGKLESCGCKSLRNHVLSRIKPKLFLSGHIHNCEDIVNAGVLKLSSHNTWFSNGSVVTDGKFGKLSSQGNLFEIDENNNIIPLSL